jgi:hypothetical protein
VTPFSPADEQAPEPQADLFTLLSARATRATPRLLRTLVAGGSVGMVAALLLGGHRYYLALPFLAALCFGIYGLAAHHQLLVTGDDDADHSRGVDSRIVMKTAGIVGVASAVAALLCFFLLLMGPSWIS